jgi:hypothetical protein
LQLDLETPGDHFSDVYLDLFGRRRLRKIRHRWCRLYPFLGLDPEVLATRQAGHSHCSEHGRSSVAEKRPAVLLRYRGPSDDA